VKRFGYIALGIGLLLCLGIVYSCGVFRKSVDTLVFLFYALFMPLGGRLLAEFPPDLVALLGGTTTGTKWIGAKFSRSYLSLVLFYGVLCGADVGIGRLVKFARSLFAFRALGLWVLWTSFFIGTFNALLAFERPSQKEEGP